VLVHRGELPAVAAVEGQLAADAAGVMSIVRVFRRPRSRRCAARRDSPRARACGT
jgi:hypothetical protein